jgi:tetratricopeptide (TPR) repeat protein
LSAALRFPFPENLKRQSKAFIAERLCRVLLTKGEFVKGVEILKPYIKEKTDYYIRYTYSTALYKSGKYDEAKHQIKKSMENIKSNKEIWLGHFMLSCIDIKKGDLTEADVNLHKAITEAGKSGKKNTDSLYLAGAFIHYKAGCKETAVKFLETAIKINPHRRGVKERLNKWKTGESDFDLLEI